MNLHECRVSEATVEYGAASSFGGHGFASLSGLEVDDTGERTGPETALLAKRITMAVSTLN